MSLLSVPCRYLSTQWIPLIKVHLLRAGFFFLTASLLPAGIVNCLIDKITTASYMHRISLTLPRFPSTDVAPTLPLSSCLMLVPLWKPAFAYRYRDRPLLIDRRLDYLSILFFCLPFKERKETLIPNVWLFYVFYSFHWNGVFEYSSEKISV